MSLAEIFRQLQKLFEKVPLSSCKFLKGRTRQETLLFKLAEEWPKRTYSKELPASW